MPNDKQVGYIVNLEALPEKYPTEKHEAVFWESLGRAVATFGFLEETLTKAIFSFTATRPYDEHEIQQAYTEWLPKLERTLADPLGNLIDTYGKAVRDNPMVATDDMDEFLNDLREAPRFVTFSATDHGDCLTLTVPQFPFS